MARVLIMITEVNSALFSPMHNWLATQRWDLTQEHEPPLWRPYKGGRLRRFGCWGLNQNERNRLAGRAQQEKVLPDVSLSSSSHSAWMAIKALWWRQILLSWGRWAGERGSSPLQVVQEFRKWSRVGSAGLHTPAQHCSQWNKNHILPLRGSACISAAATTRLLHCSVLFNWAGEKKRGSLSAFVPAPPSRRRTH